MRKRIPGLSFFTPILIAIFLLIVNSQVTLPYFVIAPGSADPVNQAIELPPDREFKPSAEMLYTTVSFSQAHPLDMLISWIDPNDDLQKQQEAIGDSSTEEFYEANRLSMEQSTLTSTQVAMERAGIDVAQKGTGAQVVRVAEGSPANGIFKPGDAIVRVNDTPITLAGQVGDLVRDMPPGTKVSLGVRGADRQERTAEIALAAHPNGKGSYMGVEIQTAEPSLDTPFPVNVDLGRVGGPSAGLAITVALLDELTPGELTGGTDVAFTGTMRPDGTVGAVGGVEQKVIAVRERSDAKVFIVPAAESDQARKAAGDGLEVVGVENLEQAIDALAAHGGDRSGLPQPPR